MELGAALEKMGTLSVFNSLYNKHLLLCYWHFFKVNTPSSRQQNAKDFNIKDDASGNKN